MIRASRLILPFGFALVAVGVTLLVDVSEPDPVLAEVDDVHLIGMEGRMSADLEWVAENGAPQTAAFVVVPEEYRGMDVVPVIVHEDGSLEVSDGALGPSAYLTAGIIAMALGITVDLSLRGSGYERGTGQVGETPDLDVIESHGFYWRT